MESSIKSFHQSEKKDSIHTVKDLLVFYGKLYERSRFLVMQNVSEFGPDIK